MAGFIQETVPTQLPLVPTDFRHALCLGETGCGKTTSFILPNIDQRLQSDCGMLIVDVKGNLHSQVKALARRHNKLHNVVEIGVPWGTKINLFKNISRSLFINTLDEINGSEKDRFWISASLNLAGQFYDVFTLIDNIKNILKDKKNICFSFQFDVKSLNNILSSVSNFKEFIDECKHVNTMFEIDKIASLIDEGINRNDLQLVRQFSKDLQYVSSKLHHFYNDIDENSPASGSGGVFFTLRNLMHTFSHTGLDGKIEIKSLLEQGKIVVLRSDAYDKNLTIAIMNILYQRLLVRNNSRHIALFIDEFQRTVSENNIPFVDLFREMKVELVAAMQNMKQLENKLGEGKCDEFLGNVLHNYTYADHRENNLDTFEFTQKGKTSIAQPIFLGNKEIVIAQLKWQELTKRPLYPGWIYYRPDGYKRAVILNVRTKESKYHYILDEEDQFLSRKIDMISARVHSDKIAS